MSQQQYAGPNRRLPAVLIVSAVPALSFCLFGPFTIFGGNPGEFERGFLELLPTLLPLAGLLWAALTLVGLLLLKGGARDRYLWLVLALGGLVWAQGTFLMHDYGALDGRGLDWQATGRLAWLDLLLWIGVPLAVLAFRTRLKTLLVPAALMIIALQVIGAYETARSFEDSPWHSQPPEVEQPPEALFQHSTGRNVVHIVLDNFQTDVFAELVAEAGLESVFDGFVLFTENAAAAPYTNLAIPSILLGRTFDGSIPDNEFHKEAAESGLPSRLHEMGYRVNLNLMMSLQGTRHSAAYRIPGTIDQTRSELAGAEALDLLDIMLFRATPHLARGWVYNDNNWRIRRLVDRAETLPKAFVHRDYLRRYARRIRAADADPAYHFIHVWPPHPPYVTRADGTPAGEALPNTRENYRHEARATLQAVTTVIESLKERKLYDNSLIVLQSDHGGAFEPDFTPKRMFALLAVKPRDSRGEMTTSRAQSSVTDVAATIVEQEGLDVDWPGESVFAISESEPRARHYAMYHDEDNETLRTVRIKGPLGSPDSYERLDPRDLAVYRPVYQYGEVANVGLEGDGTGYLGAGWSMPFPNLVWNNGHEATLEIPTEPTEQALELSLWLLPSIHGDDWPRQRIILRIADQEIGRWELTERESTKLTARIPAGLTDTDELVLGFEFPDAVRQRDIGVGQDRRLQAVALGRFRLREAGD
ncbi:sulfatase-like hydrolase/transferase [Wenzhouxiangella sp. EGI_FJ10305]|uniref:sulfatase-like hydrolase/transferase n=1 Tax=Wenzhouxiangella sp. EGI_FJ10305 TaxID=3243768 RepID=UPI0035D9DD84